MIELGLYLIIHLVLTWIFWHRITDAEGKGRAVFLSQALVLALLGLVFVIGEFAPQWFEVERWLEATVMSSIPEELFKWAAALFVIRWLDLRSKSARVSVIVYTAVAFGTFESMMYLKGADVTSFARLIPTIMHAVCGVIVAEGVFVKSNRFNRHPAIGLGIAMLIHMVHNLLAEGEGVLLLLLWTNWLFALGLIFLFAKGAGSVLFSRVEGLSPGAWRGEFVPIPDRAGDAQLPWNHRSLNTVADSGEEREQVVFGRLVSHSPLIASLRQSGWVRTCHVCQSDLVIGPSGAFPCPGCDHEFKVSMGSGECATESADLLTLLLNHGVLLLDFEFEQHLLKVMKRPSIIACRELRAIIASGRKDAARLAIRIEGHIYNAIDLSSAECHVYPKEGKLHDAFVLSGMLTTIAANSVQALLDEGVRRWKLGRRFLITVFTVAAAVGVWQIQRSGVLHSMFMAPAPVPSTFVSAEWPVGLQASQVFVVSWMKFNSDRVSLNRGEITQEVRNQVKRLRDSGKNRQHVANFLVYSPKFLLSPVNANLVAGLDSKITLDLLVDADGRVNKVGVTSDLPRQLQDLARDAASLMSGLWVPAKQDGLTVNSTVVIMLEIDLLEEDWNFEW